MKLHGWIDRLTGLLNAKAPATQDGAALTRSGIGHLNAGDFRRAYEIFKKAADLEPTVAAHQINLAFALQQTGSHELALLHLQRAVGLDGESFDAHYMLGGALERDGDLSRAAEELEVAVKLRPDFAAAYADLARVQAAKGDTAKAKMTVQAGLAMHDTYVPLHLYLGNVHMELGEFVEAERQYLRALSLTPTDVDAHVSVGRALHAQGRHDDALKSLQHALKESPDSGQILAQLAVTLEALGRLHDAVDAVQRAVALRPDDAHALNFLGALRIEQGLPDDAVVLIRRAIELSPKSLGAYCNLGHALYQSGDFVGAVKAYREGLEVGSLAEIHDNLGNALLKLAVVDEAIEHYQRAIALQPNNLNTRCNMAAALVQAGDTRGAINGYREVLRKDPGHLAAHSNLLNNLSVDSRCTPQEYLDEAWRFNDQITSMTLDSIEPIRIEPRAYLRVGLVSADLRSHPVGFFIEGILVALKDAELDLFAYPTIPIEDDLTKRIKPLFKGWKPLVGLSDETATRAIRSDGVDILIDLSGHTADNRLSLFAWRPAPVQVTWLGYFASTGVSAIDYILADPHCVPAGQEQQFTEKVWRLPETRLCFTPPAPDAAPEVAPLPALRNGYVTFGCFQRLSKITDEVIALWARVFRAIPNARLRLQSIQTGRPIYAEQILKRLMAVGLDRDRITIVGPAQRAQYLSSFSEVDIVLDTFPYTGGTTTCEALWMGAPTLTLNGNSMISRQGVAMMTCAGLPEWVAADPDDFVDKARTFASNVPALAELRSNLRARLPETPLFDPQRFAGHLKRALFDIWNTQLQAAQDRATVG